MFGYSGGLRNHYFGMMECNLMRAGKKEESNMMRYETVDGRQSKFIYIPLPLSPV